MNYTYRRFFFHCLIGSVVYVVARLLIYFVEHHSILAGYSLMHWTLIKMGESQQ